MHSKYLDSCGASSFSEALAALKKYPAPIKGMSPESIGTVIESLVGSGSVYEFMARAEEHLQGLGKDYKKADIDNHYKEPQFFRMREISRKHGDDFRRFYRDIEKARKTSEHSRFRNTADTAKSFGEIKRTPIHLLAATRSKGDEFDAVIIVDANDNEWPNRMAEDIEEERRLFYVALSRARKYLFFGSSSEYLEPRFLLECGLL